MDVVYITIDGTTYCLEKLDEHVLVHVPAERICIKEADSMAEAYAFIGYSKA